MYVRCVLWTCNTADMRVRYGAYHCPRVLGMWINVSGVTIGYLSTHTPPLVGRKEAEPAYGARIMHGCLLASDLRISVLAGMIWRVSMSYNEIFQDECIQSNNRVPDYTQGASNRHM